MKYWKSSRDEFYRKHPFPEGGFESFDKAEEWCVAIRKVHTDKFTPKPMQNGHWTVEQDVP